MISLSGCASRLPEAPTGSRPLLDAYESVVATERIQHRPLNYDAIDLTDYTRASHNELEILFPKLPNPDIVLYVFPHMRGDAPIPGYSTTFKLYGKDHYALPGEIW